MQLILIAMGILAAKSCSGFHCIDEAGSEVDWFIVYKLPRLPCTRKLEHDSELEKSCNANISNGIAYLYLDANTPSFVISKYTVNDSSSSFYRTLQQVYDSFEIGDTKVGRGLYNDAWPSANFTLSHGHTKGVYAFDSVSGFWLSHSVPHFPSFLQSKYSFPFSGTYFGQTMICITMEVSQFDILGRHFLYTVPWSYNVSIPQDIFGNDVPNLINSAINQEYVTEAPFTIHQTLTSIGGVNFSLFSKNYLADIDMISEQMAPSLKSSLYSETWQNIRPNLPSDCNGTYWTFSVEYLSSAKLGVEFSTYKDHSKWAVGVPSDLPHPSDWVCVGDMNRQTTQLLRSGGYVCLREASVNSQFTEMTENILKCSKY